MKSIIIFTGCKLPSSHLTWLPLLLWVGLHHFDWLNTLYDQICLSVMLSCVWEYATVFEIRLHMSAGPPWPWPHTHTVPSQEATGTQAPVAGVVLRDPPSGDVVAFRVSGVHTPALWYSSTLWEQVGHPPPPSPRLCRDCNKNRTLNHAPCLRDAKCLYLVGVWKFAWLWVCALPCHSGILGIVVSKAQSSHWDESERKMHSLLFLYYPTQGHTDIMKPSFCYLERAAHLQILSAKWISEKFYNHNKRSTF